MSITGRRLPDTQFSYLPLPLDELQPGDIWKYVNADGTPVSAASLYPKHDMSGNLTDCVWGYAAPTQGLGTMSLHTVRENEDGTVSIRPGDGSSNSVLHDPGGPHYWHGYVDHNVWTSC